MPPIFSLNCKNISIRAAIASLNQSNILGYIARSAKDDYFFGNERGVILALSSIFGIDEPNEDQRERAIREVIVPLLLLPENREKLQKVIQLLPGYKKWTASGAHRFIPLVLAVRNMLSRVNIFGTRNITDSIRGYMLDESPFYSNPFGVLPGNVPVYLPNLYVKVPERTEYKWLDIGSAPKRNGAPTLNVLKDNLPGVFRFYGIDILMPYYEIRDGKIVRSKYYRKEENVVNGVVYYNGKNPRFNVLSDDFLPDELFSFISICMTLQQLNDGQRYSSLPFTTHRVLDSKGRNFGWRGKVRTTKSQQAVVDRLLSHLEIGGVLFLDPHSYHPNADHEKAMLDENNYDLFFVIQRISKDTFVIYEKTPIIFRPDRDRYSPSLNIGFIEGYHEPRVDFYHHDGIRAILDLSLEEDVTRLQELFFRADLLAVRYQAWKKSVWGSVVAVVRAIRRHKSLMKVFKAYLRNVPDYGIDAKLKNELLREVREFERKHKK